MVSIRTAASFVPNNISLPSQLYTQASNFADELKKWQSIYDNYAQQEYRQQMIERLKADSELKKQQEARSDLYKQQLMDAVNNYGGDLNSGDFFNTMLSAAASNGKTNDVIKLLTAREKATRKGTGTPTKQYASDRDAKKIRAAIEQSNGDPKETENILRNNGYPGLAKKYRDSFEKPSNKEGNGQGYSYKAQVNGLTGNSPTKANQGNEPSQFQKISEEDAIRKGIPFKIGKPTYDKETNTFYMVVK